MSQWASILTGLDLNQRLPALQAGTLFQTELPTVMMFAIELIEGFTS